MKRKFRGSRATISPLERRLMLTAATAAALPVQLDVVTTPIEQALYPSGTSYFTFVGPGATADARYRRFSVDAEGPVPLTVNINGAVLGDAALALYDADGNRLWLVDNDIVPFFPSREALTYSLEPGQTYILGLAATGAFGGAAVYEVAVQLPAQNQNAPVRIDPALGTVSRAGEGDPDGFAAANDVDLYPLDLLNGGATGSIDVSATAPDTQVRATLWRSAAQTGELAAIVPGDQWWKATAGGSGSAVNLSIIPPSAGNLTDGTYLLAVAPLDFASPARSYAIDVSAAVLGPATIEPEVFTDIGMLPPLGQGVAGATRGNVLAPSLVETWRFRAPATGKIRVNLTAPIFAPVISLEAIGEGAVRVVRSRTNGGAVEFEIDGIAGAQYAVRVGNTSAALTGVYTLNIAQNYTPTPLVLTNPAIVSAINVGEAAGGRYYRLELPPGREVVSLRLSAATGSAAIPEIVVARSGAAPITKTSTSGEPVTLFLDARAMGGILEVFITSSVAGEVSLEAASIDIPDQLPGSATPSATLDLVSGDVSSVANVGGVGSVASMKHWSLNAPGTKSFAATGAPVALAEYVEQDGALRLVGFALPDALGESRRTSNVLQDRFIGLAGVSLLPEAAVITLESLGATPTGTGILMAPEPIPGDVGYGPPFSSNLKIRNVQIRNAGQRDLWETLLPANPQAGVPEMRIGPVKPGGSLALRLTILDANNNPLRVITTLPGEVLSAVSIPELTMPAAAGQRVRFLVEPIDATLGDGLYTLELKIITSETSRYLVTENTFAIDWAGANSHSLPPGVSPHFLQTNAIATGFSSSRFYNDSSFGSSGSIKVFSFNQGATPFSVSTTPFPGSTVNTNLALYRGRYSNGVLTHLDRVQAFSPSFDFFQSDRSVIDSKIIVNNTDAIAEALAKPGSIPPNGDPLWFVVVKNEQGTTGNFTLRVADEPYVTTGPGTAPGAWLTLPKFWINPTTGQAPSSTVSSGDLRRLVTPSGLFGSMTVSYTFSGQRQVRLEVLDENGNLFLIPPSQSHSSQITFNLSGLPKRANLILRTLIISGAQSSMEMSVQAPLSTTSAFTQPGNHNALTIPAGVGLPQVPEFYYRAETGPDGKFSLDIQQDPDDGLQQRFVFWVNKPGLARFDLSTQGMRNLSLSLWHGERFANETNSFYGGILTDFTSGTFANTLSLESYVLPGMYFVNVEGDATAGAPFTAYFFNMDLPDAPTQQLTLDPNSGSTSAVNRYEVDDTPGIADPYSLETATVDVFRSTYYRVVAPPASRSGLKLTATSYKAPVSGQWEGQTTMGVYRHEPNGTLTDFVSPDRYIDLDLRTPGTVDDGAMINTFPTATPGEVYYIALHRDRMSPTGKHIHLAAKFDVPESGTPDIVVDKVELSPASGQTRVSITLRNNGFATVGGFRSLLKFSNYRDDVFITIPGLGPLTSVTYVYYWNPDDFGDKINFTADVGNLIEERNELNNFGSATLMSHKPDATLTLADGRFDGIAAAGVWGRYVSGVEGVNADIIADPFDPEGEGDIYQTYITFPSYSSTVPYNGGGSHVISKFDFSRFKPTTAANPNLIRYYVKDNWGLRGPEHTIVVDVVPKPRFYTTITWNPATFRYDLAWKNDIIRFDRTVSQIVGFSMPLIGDKSNKFIVATSANGSATLNPADPITLPLKAEVNLTAVDVKIIDEKWEGTTRPTDHLTVYTSVAVNSRTLDPTAAAASFQLRDLPIFEIRSPKIPLFAFGIPGVAAIQASFSIGLEASLDAGVKFGIDPAILSNPLTVPNRVGLMSPTFIRPEVVGSAIISGDVTVLGFDIASLEGSLRLGLNITLGLDNGDPSAVIPFDEAIDRLAIKVQGSIGFGMAAEFLGFEIWSWEPDPYTFDIADTSTRGGIITNEPGVPGGAPLPGANPGLELFNAILSGAPLPGSLPLPGSAPTFRKGSDLVGPYAVASPPQIVIDPIDSSGLTVQIIDTDPSPANTLSGLVYSARAPGGGAWTALAPVPGAHDVANPVLVRTNTGFGHAMLTYEKINTATPPANQTLAQRLAARDLRYRFWDGATWGPERILTAAAGSDSEVAMSFGYLGGSGVAAWVHNTAAVPMGEDGFYKRNNQEIHAAVWDSVQSEWGAPSILTTDSIADSKPAVFADDDTGALFVVWIRETTGGANQLMYATFDGTDWSTPAVLPVTGLAPGGVFTSVALGSNAADRLNVIFNYRNQLADRSVDTKLYNRPSTIAGFANPAGVEIIAAQSNYSHVRTNTMPDGSLLVSWQQGDGVTNEVFASILRSSGPWSTPARLTSSPIVEKHPAVAAEPDGTLKLLYEISDISPPPAPGPQPGGLPTDIPTVPGIGSTVAATLPDLLFSRRLLFDHTDLAVEGTTQRGSATVINRGLAATDATIEYLVGPPGAEIVVANEAVRLSPGATYLASFDFTVSAGVNRYAIRVVTNDVEIGGTDDNITVFTLQAAPDIEVLSLTPADPALPPGPDNPLQVVLRNNSSASIDPFDLKLFAGDPLFPQTGATLITTIRIPSLAAFETLTQDIPVTAIVNAGTYLYSAIADTASEIAEAVEGNNRATYQLTLLADPLITGDPVATLLNTSGVENVTVDGAVRNDGSAPSSVLVVKLLHSLNGAPFTEVASQNLASLTSGEESPVSFTTHGLAGDNRYRIVVESAVANDANPANNVGETLLVINGFADFTLPTAPVPGVPRVTQGEPMNVTLTLRNLGIAAGENVLVEIFAALPGQSPFVVGTLRVPRVEPLSVQSLSIALDTTALTGTFDLYAVVDIPDDVLELDDANNTSPAVSFTIDADDGLAPTVTAAQLVVTAWPHTLSYTFSKSVAASLALADLSLFNTTTGQTIAAAAAATLLAYDAATHTATFRLHGSLPNGNYIATLLAAGVTDGLGRTLASNHTLPFFILSSDFNRDRVVNHLDFSILHANFGLAAADTFAEGDANGDGLVNFADFQKLETDFGKSIPTPASPAPAKPTKPIIKPAPRPVAARQPASKIAVRPAVSTAVVPKVAAFSTTRIKRRPAVLA